MEFADSLPIKFIVIEGMFEGTPAQFQDCFGIGERRSYILNFAKANKCPVTIIYMDDSKEYHFKEYIVTRLEEIQDLSRRLSALLADPQPGLFSWAGAFNDVMRDINKFWIGDPTKMIVEITEINGSSVEDDRNDLQIEFDCPHPDYIETFAIQALWNNDWAPNSVSFKVYRKGRCNHDHPE